MRPSMSNPSEREFLMTSSGNSSNVINTPGSLNSVTPRTRNSTPNMLLPQPAPPHTSVGRPFGNPPSVISSRPLIPVGDFGKEIRFFVIAFFRIISSGSEIKYKMGHPAHSYNRAFTPWMFDSNSAFARKPPKSFYQNHLKDTIPSA